MAGNGNHGPIQIPVFPAQPMQVELCSTVPEQYPRVIIDLQPYLVMLYQAFSCLCLSFPHSCMHVLFSVFGTLFLPTHLYSLVSLLGILWNSASNRSSMILQVTLLSLHNTLHFLLMVIFLLSSNLTTYFSDLTTLLEVTDHFCLQIWLSMDLQKVNHKKWIHSTLSDIHFLLALSYKSAGSSCAVNKSWDSG